MEKSNVKLTHRINGWDHQLSTWDHRFLKHAYEVSQWSKDPRSKVGCIIARGSRQLGQGYNGFPDSIEDRPEWLNDREVKNRLMIHAEDNAIADAKQRGTLFGSTLYNYPFAPCGSCAKQIAREGIKHVFAPTGRPEFEEEAAFVFDKANVGYAWLDSEAVEEFLNPSYTTVSLEAYQELQNKYSLLAIELEAIAQLAEDRAHMLVKISKGLEELQNSNSMVKGVFDEYRGADHE